VIGEVRGRGLMIGMELVEDRATKKPAKAARRGRGHRAFHNGLLLLTCGQSAVRFMPPLHDRRARGGRGGGRSSSATLDEVLAAA
jgi:4-aminobutyrate aminotransferase